ncbi:hypothetical protein DH2020_008108 [Rehmannia glutinosa]|uniref:Leishmanolysin-like peptidase n=1 Tax=Rehmannia glutinosa TaxID=99300 RepID=A0ABR0U032_REHGL
MELRIRCNRCAEVSLLPRFELNFAIICVKVLLVLLLLEASLATTKEFRQQRQVLDQDKENIISHSCIHDQIIEQRKKPGRKVYSVSAQVYVEPDISKSLQRRGRALLCASDLPNRHNDAKQPIRIYLNYDAVGHSSDRDCRNVGDILGEPAGASYSGAPSCNPLGDPPIYALGQTADWFKRALSVEPVRGNLRLSGYSACGQDGGVQLPREYVEGNTLAWAVACERDQWGRAIAGHVNVAPRHLTAEAETLLSATLIHEVMHVLGFDPHAFAHFRDERKRRRTRVTEQAMDEKLGRVVTRVVLPRVIMHSRYHYGAFSQNFTGLELEDGGSHWEKRLLMNEIMTGSVDTRSVVSKMTLALLEDSGWYRANYSMADRLDWGRNQGTEFVTFPCNLWKGAYRCNSTQFSGCTYNREAEGYCPIVNYSGDLPEWARYFPQANKGGQSSLADYCTYFVAYSDGSCTDTNSARAPDGMLGEMRGSSSRCMASSLVRSGFVRGSTSQGNGCYQHRCINNSLEVAVDGLWKVCPEAGGPVKFPGFNGNDIVNSSARLTMNSAMTIQSLYLVNVLLHAIIMVTALMEDATAFWGLRAMIVASVLALTTVLVMVSALKMVFVTVNMGTQGLTVLQFRAMLQVNNIVPFGNLPAVCDEQCSLHGGVCDNGVCEFRCSDYAGYTCQNSSTLLPSLSACKDVLEKDKFGQHCAPSELSILQQLEQVVVMPNYHRLFPGGPRKFLNYIRGRDCDGAAKRLACWISIQKCDEDGDNRLRVCHSACQSYNQACGASLDCSDQTLFSHENEGEGLCTGWGEISTWL